MFKFDDADELFVGDEILKEFSDCSDCGLCCKFFSHLPLYETEISELSKILKISPEEFRQVYSKRIENTEESVRYSLKTPCPFLEKNTCQIYNHRFLICRTFPLCINLTKNKAILSGIYVCPQATQFYEGLLEFLQNHQKKIYKQLIEKEKLVTLDERGMKIMGKATIFASYLDWLHLKKED
jgi:Fe-S-cluster containining protein